MKLFNFFKKKQEKTILEKSLNEVARINNARPLKGIEAVDRHYKKHPFNIKKIKNTERKYRSITCPYCKSGNVARYSYGMPMLNKELEEKLNNKEIILGGCCIMPNSPQYHCNKCGKDWGKAHL